MGFTVSYYRSNTLLLSCGSGGSTISTFHKFEFLFSSPTGLRMDSEEASQDAY